VDLSDNSGGFRLTIAKWLTPDKRWIHMKGLTPDLVVPAAATARLRPATRTSTLAQGARSADRERRLVLAA